MNIGFIGLGAMGLPMAENLLKGGHRILAHDPSPPAAARAEALGMTVCKSAAEAGQAETVFLSLPNAAIVEQAAVELTQARPPDLKTVIDTSSIAPASAIQTASILEKAGVRYADCPVSGGVQGARDGSLVVMVGADPATMERIAPLLALIGGKVHHVGGVGGGSAVKMINNFMLGCNMASAAEALVLGAKLGLDLAVMHEIIRNSSGRSFIIENKVPGFIMKRKFAPGFQIDLAYKDLGLSAESARQLGLPIPMGSAAIQVFETARAKGLGKEDISALVKIWEELAGVEVK